MSSPDPTRRPGGFQGPDDAEPTDPFYPYGPVEDEMAAYFDRVDAEEAGFLRRARRRRLLTRAAIALFGLVVAAAVLFGVAAIRGGQRPTTGPTTVPAPVTVPAPGATGTSGYIPVPAGKP